MICYKVATVGSLEGHCNIPLAVKIHLSSGLGKFTEGDVGIQDLTFL